MNQKSLLMMKLLDQKVKKCKECNLNEKNRLLPYWTSKSKYAMIVTCSDDYDHKNNEILKSMQSKGFWIEFAKRGFVKQDFLILPTTICRVINNGHQGNPSEYHRNCCKKWLRGYLKIINPEKIILFGDYAACTLMGKWPKKKKNEKVECVETLTGNKIKCFKALRQYSFLNNEYCETKFKNLIEKFKGK